MTAAHRDEAAPARPADRDASSLGMGLAIALLSVVPLLYPRLPPLVDYPEHLSRYRIALDYPRSALFRAWFDVHHVLIGNLGVDLAVAWLAPALGMVAATRIVVAGIPVLTAIGLMMISRSVHGRITPLVPLATVLVYNYPFDFGFLNYGLSMALALCAFGAWVRLDGRLRPAVRSVLFVPVAMIVWLAHASGWGALGLMIAAWEGAAARRGRLSWLAAVRRVAVRCGGMAVPAVQMLIWSLRTPPVPVPSQPDVWAMKIAFFFSMLFDGDQLIDTLAAVLLVLVALLPLTRTDLRWNARLGPVALVLLAAFVLMPSNIIGSTYADLRLAPYAMMIVLLCLEPTRPTTFVARLGRLAWLLFGAQIAAHTIHYRTIADEQQHQLAALDHIPGDTTVFAMVKGRCPGDVSGPRLDHLARMAIVMKGDVTNDSWPFPATQTITPRAAMTRGYHDDGSSTIGPFDCAEGVPVNSLEGQLLILPRDRFRYLWLLDFRQEERPTRPWLHPIWSNDLGAVYAIDPAGGTTATGRR